MSSIHDIIRELYSIYPDGRVIRKRDNKERRSHVSSCGYYRFSFSINKKRYTISHHRLVAMECVPGFSKVKNEVNHIDGDKSNNRADNLEWVSRKQNMEHSGKVLKNKHGKHKVKTLRNKAIKDLKKVKYKNEEIAAIFNISTVRVSQIIGTEYN